MNVSGKNITLNCTLKATSSDNYWSIWYKQRLKKEPQQVGRAKIKKLATISSPFNNSRFIMKWSNDTTNSLTIVNLTEEDEGAYFCGVAEKSEHKTLVNRMSKPQLFYGVECRKNISLYCTINTEKNKVGGLMTVMFTKHCCSFTQQHNAEELNYAAIHINERKTKRGQVKRGQSENSMYSEVKRSAPTHYHLDY
uniref:Ig-like domain-containing protein n=1 Tax=Electrophorus electricus TaxID=8005 RepID=A0AAY5EWR2_ELEEL